MTSEGFRLVNSYLAVSKLTLGVIVKYKINC